MILTAENAENAERRRMDSTKQRDPSPKGVLDRITSSIIGAAIEVHRELGPGLLESAYEACLAHELTVRGHYVQRQVHLPIVYKNIQVDVGFRADMLIDERVILELKSTAKLTSLDEAQLLSYLRQSGCRVGLLINFNVTVLTSGIKRMVHNLEE